jgi:hypothetical protein
MHRMEIEGQTYGEILEGLSLSFALKKVARGIYKDGKV